MASDTDAPRVFTVVTSGKITYNMDTVEYLMAQETQRRRQSNLPALGQWEAGEFRRQLISKLIIQNDAEGAIALRPTATTRKQLNG
jgi:hypothetical protein